MGRIDVFLNRIVRIDVHIVGVGPGIVVLANIAFVFRYPKVVTSLLSNQKSAWQIEVYLCFGYRPLFHFRGCGLSPDLHFHGLPGLRIIQGVPVAQKGVPVTNMKISGIGNRIIKVEIGAHFHAVGRIVPVTGERTAQNTQFAC